MQKKTKGICGQNLFGLCESRSPNMLLVKMLMASYQQYMSVFAPTWKKVITKSGRSVFRLVLSERTMKDTGFAFLASPRASQDHKPIRVQTPKEHSGKHGQTLCASIGIIYPEHIGRYINPPICGMVNGIPDWMGGYKQYRERMQCYGNAVVPAQFYPVFRAIAELALYYEERCADEL